MARVLTLTDPALRPAPSRLPPCIADPEIELAQPNTHLRTEHLAEIQAEEEWRGARGKPAVAAPVASPAAGVPRPRVGRLEPLRAATGAPCGSTRARPIGRSPGNPPATCAQPSCLAHQLRIVRAIAAAAFDSPTGLARFTVASAAQLQDKAGLLELGHRTEDLANYPRGRRVVGEVVGRVDRNQLNAPRPDPQDAHKRTAGSTGGPPNGGIDECSYVTLTAKYVNLDKIHEFIPYAIRQLARIFCPHRGYA